MTDRIQFMRKVCSTCHVEKGPSEFNKRRTVAGSVVLAGECRECHKSTAKTSRERTEKPRTPLKQSDKPMRAENPEAKAKRDTRRKKARASPEERAAKKAAKIRANGMCECGCGFPFGEYYLDKPEFHHPNTTSYDKHEGILVRKRCHVRLEISLFPHRHPSPSTL